MNESQPAFYVTGGTMRPDSPSYVERCADTALYEALARGEFCYVLTSRQMGKSSLMVRTAARLRSMGITVLILDLTSLGQNLSPEHWYAGMLSEVGQQLDLEAALDDYWLAHAHLSPVQRWTGALREVVLPALGVGPWALGVGTDDRPTATDDRPASKAQLPTPNAAPARSVRSCPTPNAQRRLVIFIDEIDAVRSLPFSADEFFAAIRACHNRRPEDRDLNRLTFCLLGVATPSDLIRDTRITPFNIGERVELTDFTAEEAAPLAAGLLGVQEGSTRFAPPPCASPRGPAPELRSPRPALRAPAPSGVQGKTVPSALNARTPERLNAQRLLKRILYWTGGHPYLTQRLCRAVAEDGGVAGPAGVDHVCEEVFLSKSAQTRDDNLLFVRDRLLRCEVDLAGLMELYGRVRSGRPVAVDDTNQLVSVLQLSGITRVADARGQAPDARRKRRGNRNLLSAPAGVLPGAWRLTPDACLEVRNRIYERVFDRQWVLQHMPDAELRRQRAAYRRGLARATVVWGAVLTLTGALAVTALKQARRAESATVLAHREEDTERRLLYAADLNLAQEKYRAAEIGAALRLLEETRPRPGQPDLRDFEWGYLWRLCHQNRRTLQGHTDGIEAVAFSPDGRILASGGRDRSIKLWDPVTARQIRSLRAGRTNGVNSLAFSRDGRHLAVSAGVVKLWDPRTGRLERVFPVPKADTTSVALSPDGKALASGHTDGTARLWDAASGRQIRVLRTDSKGAVWSVAFSPDGKRLATGHNDGTARLWDAATGRPLRVLRGHSSFVYSLAFSPDGSRLATAGGDGTICLWDPVAGELLRALAGHSPYAANSLAFSPDGRRLASAGWDTTVRLWDTATGKAEGTLLGHLSYAWCVAWSPDGRTLASAGYDRLLNLWDMAGEPPVRILRGHTSDIDSAALSSDGARLATGSLDGTAKVWDVATGRTLCTLRGRPGLLYVALSPDGRRVVTLPEDGRARVWDAATGDLLYRVAYAVGVTHIAFSPDGGRLLTVDGSGTVEVGDARTGRELLRLPGASRRATAFANSPDGRRVATADGTTARIWDVGTRRALFTLHNEHEIWRIVFLPNSGRVLTTDSGGNVKVWDPRTGRALFTAPLYAPSLAAFSLSRDGRLVATGSNEGSAQLWDAETGRELLRLNAAHTGQVFVAMLSPDGRRLVTAGGDNRVKIWDLATGRELLVLQGHARDVTWAAFTPDGRRLITTSWDKTARVWESVIGSSAPPATEPVQR